MSRSDEPNQITHPPQRTNKLKSAYTSSIVDATSRNRSPNTITSRRRVIDDESTDDIHMRSFLVSKDDDGRDSDLSASWLSSTLSSSISFNLDRRLLASLMSPNNTSLGSTRTTISAKPNSLTRNSHHEMISMRNENEKANEAKNDSTLNFDQTAKNDSTLNFNDDSFLPIHRSPNAPKVAQKQHAANESTKEILESNEAAFLLNHYQYEPKNNDQASHGDSQAPRRGHRVLHPSFSSILCLLSDSESEKEDFGRAIKPEDIHKKQEEVNHIQTETQQHFKPKQHNQKLTRTDIRAEPNPLEADNFVKPKPVMSSLNHEIEGVDKVSEREIESDVTENSSEEYLDDDKKIAYVTDLLNRLSVSHAQARPTRASKQSILRERKNVHVASSKGKRSTVSEGQKTEIPFVDSPFTSTTFSIIPKTTGYVTAIKKKNEEKSNSASSLIDGKRNIRSTTATIGTFHNTARPTLSRDSSRERLKIAPGRDLKEKKQLKSDEYFDSDISL